MNFIDGILNGVRSAAGLNAIGSSKHTSNDTTPAKQTGRVATKVGTTFEQPARDNGARPADLGTLARAALQAPAAVPPHATADRSTAPPAAAAATPAGPRARATVRDASHGFQVLGDVDTLANGDAAIAARNVQAGLDYYGATFGRNGLDNAGSGVDVDINDFSTDATGTQTFHGNGGYYATTQSDGTTYEAIHYGDGNTYTAAKGTVAQASMLHAEDLAIHELTHGVIRKETGFLGGGADEAGATNEAIADIMGASATRDWTLGESMYGAGSDYRNMRNIANPDDPTSVHGLWTTMDQVRAKQSAGQMEEHWASGVLSTAAYRVQQRIGGDAGWKAVEQVFYNVIDTNKLGDMSFGAVARGARSAADELYGAGSHVSTVVNEELQRGGL
ncbi:MAG: M4 family metallopeptidase [Thermoleophilia bacterium]|nr:M4 family metallopeptidase [Thermoleophilia bacterium]